MRIQALLCVCVCVCVWRKFRVKEEAKQATFALLAWLTLQPEHGGSIILQNISNFYQTTWHHNPKDSILDNWLLSFGVIHENTWETLIYKQQ
jgi:hypothetical protein